MENFTIPTSFALKRYSESDFATETKDKICIYNENCTLLLFYSENIESKQVLQVFKRVAESVPGITFGVCNLMLERKIGEIFIRLRNEQDHPFTWAAQKLTPFILVYRNGYPAAFYEGPNDVETLINFSLNIAPDPRFSFRNLGFIQRIKEEIWITYSYKNPVILGGPMQQFTRPKYEPPAIPFK
jgi:hypothetical protein